MSGTETSPRFENEAKASLTSHRLTTAAREVLITEKEPRRFTILDKRILCLSCLCGWGSEESKVSFHAWSCHSWGKFSGKVSAAAAHRGADPPTSERILSRLPLTKRQSSIDPLPHRTAKNSLRAPPTFDSASFTFAQRVSLSCLFDLIITTRELLPSSTDTSSTTSSS